MTIIYYICAFCDDWPHMAVFLKMYRKSTKRLIHDDESLDSRLESICSNEYRKWRPVQRNEKLRGTPVDLIAIEYFSRFIDDIVFVFNDVFNY